jgi:hypothetical protein
MPFANFTNPFQNPTNVPEKYHRQKAKVERMILGEELAA